MKYDKHKTGCAASSYKCFICFQLPVNTFQTTTTGLIDLKGVGVGGGGGSGGGGVGAGGWGHALYLWPLSEPAASERLLSA